MTTIVGIPARMGATRLPGKPLAPILGMPMIRHVYERCCLAEEVDRVFIAACDDEVREIALGFGAEVIMTDPTISRPGLRVAEACRIVNIAEDDFVVVVQGDEPLVHPGMVTDALAALDGDPTLLLGTLVSDASDVEWSDPDEVKVVTNLAMDIMYMSRSPIPSDTLGAYHRRLKQVAVMPFRASFLQQFQKLTPTPYEEDEAIELVRALEHGVRVAAIYTRFPNVSVDTASGLAEAEEAMRHDLIFSRYGS